MTYYVDTPADLQNIDNDLKGDYVLLHDIDLAGTSFTPIGKGDPAGFQGTLDGQGFAIKNLTQDINDMSGWGLFAVCTGVNIHHMDLLNFTVSYRAVVTPNSDKGGGALAGAIHQDVGGRSSTITDVHVINVQVRFESEENLTAQLEDWYLHGGLVGWGEAIDFVDCTVTGDFVAKLSYSEYQTIWSGNTYTYANAQEFDTCGGFAGEIDSGNFTRCGSSLNLNVTGDPRKRGKIVFGGFIGYLQEESHSRGGIINGEDYKNIVDCYYDGEIFFVSGNAYYLGGFIGDAFTDLPCVITGCWHEGDMVCLDAQNDSCFCHFIEDWYTEYTQDVRTTIEDCYSRGNIIFNGVDNGDGLAGFFHEGDGCNMNRCYYEGILSSTIQATEGYTGWQENYLVGGFLGDWYGKGNITNCYCRGKIVANMSVSGDIYNIGGFVGDIYNENYDTGSCIRNCYSAMDIKVEAPYQSTEAHDSLWGIGGFIGDSYFRKNAESTGPIIIENCYYCGRMSVNSPITEEQHESVGGFAGSIFWNTPEGVNPSDLLQIINCAWNALAFCCAIGEIETWVAGISDVKERHILTLTEKGFGIDERNRELFKQREHAVYG